MSTQVVIAGAGPVGLMLAAELRLAGVDVVVLERLAEPTGQARAIGVHARTVEVWDQRGVADRFAGPTVPRYGYSGGLAPIEFAPLDTRFGMRLIPQTHTERELGNWATELGAELRRGHALTGFHERDGGVEVAVAGPAGEYRLDAQWLAGCDGAGSTVRKLAGINFPGTARTVELLSADVADVPEHTPFRTEIPYIRRNEVGHLLVLPVLPDAYRVILYEFGRKPSGDREPPPFAEICALARRIGDLDISEATPRWCTRFGNAARQAETYRRGRVLLVGDAAHVHMPAAGQGLNLGVQDAVNLGWKLAAAVHGWAPPGLLDSFERERAPVAAQVLTDTQAQFALLAGGPESAALRSVFADLLRFERPNRLLAGRVSALTVRYDVGCGDASHDLLGARLPHRELVAGGVATSSTRLLHPARGLLLDVDTDPALLGLAEGWSDRVDTVAVTEPRDWPDGAATVLVRPDGHVAWVGAGRSGDKDALHAALHRWFGPAGVWR
ncbi:FAD-dependent monooxygenase [Amycolatopsis cihanbeyliensis]|uniref:Bifunctional hydroxylase/dehydrase n=1 Tax=Amycolatopsis cihanbeyliensis TaxID=1128664 RepID=A0A542DBT1_AMYCI|nr:FAD-dependent monooxygenase [Amycolatopsis cihanbeyliensis]TQJ00513.1 bifunctional hydroxylase/dehydrase [Amycolatopsis cihanbeyliensis]